MAEYYRMKNRTDKGSEDRRNTDRNGKSSFSIRKDGKEFHYCPPWQMESDSVLLDDFKRSVKCHGGYSEDEARNFSNDDSNVRFLNTDYLPDRYSTQKKVHFDLTVGEQEAKNYDGTPLQGFHNFLSWILSNDKEYKKLIATAAKSGGKFVFLKNILTKLFLAPYNHGKHVTFYATCVNGIIYLMNSVNLTELKKCDTQLSLRAHKFQRYLVSAEKEKLICNPDYRCVLSSLLGQHQLLYSASVNCFNPEKYDPKKTDLSAAITFKCQSDKCFNEARFIMLVWCVGIVVGGAPEILVGYRTDEGIVHSLKLFDEQTLIMRGREFWDLNHCSTFANNLLSYVQTTTERNPGAVFMFEKKTRCNYFTCSEQSVEEFPPDWFTNEFHSEK